MEFDILVDIKVENYLDIVDNIRYKNMDKFIYESNNQVIELKLNDSIIDNDYLKIEEIRKDIEEKYKVKARYDSLENFVVTRNFKYGVVNKEGIIIIPIKYDYIHEDKNYYYVSDANKGKMFDKSGNIVVKKKYKNIKVLNDDRFLIETDKKNNNYYKIINKKGKVILQFKCDDDLTVSYGSIIVNHKSILTNNYSVIKYLGYDHIYSFLNDYAIVSQHNLDGVIDKNGKLIIPLKYDYMSYFAEDNLYLVKVKEKYGVIDGNDNIIVPIMYKSVNRHRNLALADTDTNSIIYDFKGNKIYELESNLRFVDVYDNLIVLEDKDGYFRLIDRNGNLIIPKCEDKIEVLSNRYILLDKKLIDLEQEYLNIKPFYNLIVKYDNRNYTFSYDNYSDCLSAVENLKKQKSKLEEIKKEYIKREDSLIKSACANEKKLVKEKKCEKRE